MNIAEISTHKVGETGSVTLIRFERYTEPQVWAEKANGAVRLFVNNDWEEAGLGVLTISAPEARELIRTLNAALEALEWWDGTTPATEEVAQ